MMMQSTDSLLAEQFLLNFLPQNNQLTRLTNSTESITLPIAEDPESIMDQLAIIQGQLKHMLNWKEQLLDQLSDADDNGLLDNYRNISNDKQIIWDEMTITKSSRTVKHYNDCVIEELDRIKEVATRNGHFTKTTKESYTLRINH